VRRAGGKVRVSAQLIDAKDDKHIWAESYDRALVDPLAAQEDIADRIAIAVEDALATRRATMAPA
jgi:TolB-like protein